MKRGAGEVVDTIDYGYRDPFDLSLMGETAENLTDDFGYERADMDLYALESQQRAAKAIESGFLAEQVAPIEVPAGRGRRGCSTSTNSRDPRRAWRSSHRYGRCSGTAAASLPATRVA